MINIIDIHTHRLDAPQALISVDPRQFVPRDGLYYSVGYHPWHDVDRLTEEDFDLLEQCARHPQVLAIGETGMDQLRGAPLHIQGQVFVRHLLLAREVGKPVVAHCVRASQDILTTRHHAGLDDVTLVIHGMRSNERIARTLLQAGCHLSFGTHFHPAALLATPPDRLLIETDDGPATIDDVACLVADTMGKTREEVMTLARHNSSRLLTIIH